MGVRGLWRLLLPIGRRISLESLEGQTLAIDASIWLTQMIEAMRDPETGRVQASAHLSGFFRRICKLLFYGIRPVFVFDGATPEIKLREVQRRRQQRDQWAKLSQPAIQRLARRLLQDQLGKKKQFRGEFLPSSDDSKPVEEDRKPAADGTWRASDVPIEATTAAVYAADDLDHGDEEGWKPDDDLQVEAPAAALYADEDSDEKGKPTFEDLDLRWNDMTPHERKDAMEDAKRAQRLQSRREFMPAAADPLQFSQVQVSNFLRSTRLNKLIANKMVTSCNSSSDAMASNLAMTVVLEREDDVKPPSDERPPKRQRVVDLVELGLDSESSDDGCTNDNEGGFIARNVHSSGGGCHHSNSGEAGFAKEMEPSSIGLTDKRVTTDYGRAERSLHLPVKGDVPSTVGVTSGPCEDEARTTTPPSRRRPLYSDDLISHGGGPAASSDDEEDIAWEDGDALPDGPNIEVQRTSWYRSPSHDSHEACKSVPLNEDHHTAPPDSFQSPRHPRSPPNASSISPIQPLHPSPSHQSQQLSPGSRPFVSSATTAALARAEAQAANLADWAGRAFRRALMDLDAAAEVSMDSALRNQVVDVDEGRATVEEPGVFLESVAENSTKVAVQELEAVSDRPTNRTDHDGYTPVVHDEFGEPDEDLAASFDFATDEALWKAERNRRERDMEAVSDDMKEEVVAMLRLFGIPFVDAPAEAEAQCATLEMLGLVDGIVTEDSDVFVFGGQKVYKNLFNERHHAEAYFALDASREMSLNRNAMVALAMLLGSDYTVGIKGVGIVNAMEILQTFDVKVDLVTGLRRLREWLDGIDVDKADHASSPDISLEDEFTAKHKSARGRWIAPESFPSEKVVNAYTHPVVDASTEGFSWGKPKVNDLVAFCSRTIGWDPTETQRLLDPVVNVQNSQYRQMRLDSFMSYGDGIKFADVRSERLREVLRRKNGDKRLSSREGC